MKGNYVKLSKELKDELDTINTGEKYNVTYKSSDVYAAFHDLRSWEDKECWHVYPIALTDNQVMIICPYCGQIHYHGNNNGHYEGHRVSHCSINRHDNHGYIIERIDNMEDSWV